MKRNWLLLKGFTQGHKYFEVSCGKIAIADQSGETPDQCEDGVWYLHIKEVIKANESPIPGFCLPLVDENGNRSSAIISNAEALWCNEYLDMEFDKPAQNLNSFLHNLD